jgi:hypothetical protein
MNVTFSATEMRELTKYIADYLAEENVAEVDSYLIEQAIDAFLGGAR